MGGPYDRLGLCPFDVRWLCLVIASRGQCPVMLTRFRVLHYLVDLRDEIGRSNGSQRGTYTKSDEVATNMERPRVRKAFQGWPVKHG
jgi:hypothetical protein